jgi:hypothetical protein
MNHNFPVLCDDFVVLNQQGSHTLVVPAYPEVRLWPDTLSTLFDHNARTTPVSHYSEKRRLALDGDDGQAVSGEIGAQTLSRRESVIELSKYAHLLDVSDSAQSLPEVR